MITLTLHWWSGRELWRDDGAARNVHGDCTPGYRYTLLRSSAWHLLCFYTKKSRAVLPQHVAWLVHCSDS